MDGPVVAAHVDVAPSYLYAVVSAEEESALGSRALVVRSHLTGEMESVTGRSTGSGSVKMEVCFVMMIDLQQVGNRVEKWNRYGNSVVVRVSKKH